MNFFILLSQRLLCKNLNEEGTTESQGNSMSCSYLILLAFLALFTHRLQWLVCLNVARIMPLSWRKYINCKCCLFIVFFGASTDTLSTSPCLHCSRFARDCLQKFNSLVKQLTRELGPDTEDLQLRVGLHSGPVTAGVLRGDRARFQLFGDTVRNKWEPLIYPVCSQYVFALSNNGKNIALPLFCMIQVNTTARMESTGAPSRIHVSQELAERLASAGKSHWIRQREEKVQVKGKQSTSSVYLLCVCPTLNISHVLTGDYYYLLYH